MRAGSVAGREKRRLIRDRTADDSPVRTVVPMPAAPRDSDGTTRTDAERKNKFGRVRAIRDFARA
jgi:hypothetical protein